MAPDELKAALVRVSEAYRDRKDAVIEAAAERRTRRQHELPLPSGETVVADSIVNDVLRALEGAYEPQHGGFGSQPKFPMAAAVELLLHAYRTTGDTRYRRMVEKTMDEMMRGGLCDHQGGPLLHHHGLVGGTLREDAGGQRGPPQPISSRLPGAG